MRARPAYFDSVQQTAREHWVELERSPKLAGPWWALFKQVQYPRHVLSELLQNADDAGATWARAYVRDGAFHFEHDGRDFAGEEFDSLCSFGHSNKRHLHTIGFRGVGFKSTFSLGPRVELVTPSLQVAFLEERFTEPLWLEDAQALTYTRVRVAFKDDYVRDFMAKEIRRWASDALPLLFFRHLEQLQLQDTWVAREGVGPGPTPGSKVFRIHGEATQELIRIRSSPAHFPEDAVEEIRRERGAMEMDLPPVAVDVILGLPGAQRMYVVLPTDTRVGLPFSINAPFIQDTARNRIKDPVNSPTNRWLLRQAGRLAAEACAEWVSTESLSVPARAHGYQLLPEPPSDDDDTLEASVAGRVSTAFGEHFSDGIPLLTSRGSLTGASDAIALDPTLFDVWEGEVLRELFCEGDEEPLAPDVPGPTRELLAAWAWLEPLAAEFVGNRLRDKPVPRPATDERLLVLWQYVANLYHRFGTHYAYDVRVLPLVPVSGSGRLRPGRRVTRLGGHEGLGVSDRELLTRYVDAVDRGWVALLDRELPEETDALERQRHEDARRLQEKLGLASPTPLSTIFDLAADAVFGREYPGGDGVRLALLAARADLAVPEAFRYRDVRGQWHRRSRGVLLDAPYLDVLLPPGTNAYPILDSSYAEGLDAKNVAAWERWAGTPKSGLLRFPALEKLERTGLRRREAERFVLARGGRVPDSYPYVRGDFMVLDHDFPADLVGHWEAQIEDDRGTWVDILIGLSRAWSEVATSTRAHVRQCGYSKTKPIAHGTLTARWVERLRAIESLPDDYDRLCPPDELYRRTKFTLHLVGTESFLRKDLDDALSGELLDLIGLRSKPADVSKVLERLRILSTADEIMEREISRYYEILDRSWPYLSPEDRASLQDAFRDEDLILSDGGAWYRAGQAGVFLTNPHDIPGLPVILPQVRNLRLWEELDVPLQPTSGHLMEWLAALPEGEPLPKEQRRSATFMLAQSPVKISKRLGRWLSWGGTWSRLDHLEWRSSHRHSLTGLFDHVRRQVARTDMLDADVAAGALDDRPLLEEHLSFRPVEALVEAGASSVPGWLRALGRYLMLAWDEEPAAASDGPRSTAGRLLRTKLHPVDAIRVVPYLDGQPVGEARQLSALWLGEALYVRGSLAKAHGDVAQALGEAGATAALRQAIRDSIGRSATWVQEYFEERFELSPDQLPELPEAGRPGGPAERGSEVEGRNDPRGKQAGIVTGEADGGGSGAHPEYSEAVHSARRRHRRPRGSDYFAHLGFSYDASQDRFVGEDGGQLVPDEGPLTYAHRQAEGDVTTRYWVARRSLDEGAEVPYEVWDVLSVNARSVRLVFPGKHGGYECYEGERIRGMLKDGVISLHPASYRLRRS